MIIEAFNELEEIAPLNRAHPAVLLMRSRIYLAGDKPEHAHAILSTYTQQLPDSPAGWFYLACAYSKRREVAYRSSELLLQTCAASLWLASSSRRLARLDASLPGPSMDTAAAQAVDGA